MDPGLRRGDVLFCRNPSHPTPVIPAQAGIHAGEAVPCGEVVGLGVGRDRVALWRAEGCRQPAKRAEASRTVRFDRSHSRRNSSSGIGLPKR